MLESIKIAKLFGRFNYKISFSSNGIVIITGPNGYGKSTILRIINSLCNESVEKVLAYPYQQLLIKCDDCSLEIKKKANVITFNGNDIPNFLQYPKDEMAHRVYRREFYQYLDREVIKDRKLARDFMNMEDGEESEFVNSVLYSILMGQSQPNAIMGAIKRCLDSIRAIRNSIGNVYFIQEQRLIERKAIQDPEGRARNRQEYISTIKENSEKLKLELSDIMKKHSALSSNLDSTYIERLFQANPVTGVSEDMLSKLEELQEKQENLQRYGLAGNQSVSYLNQLNKDKLKRFDIELSIYLSDANAKYQVFEPIIEKLNLYEKIVNEKLTFKRIRLSSVDGISVVTDENVVLPLTELSSGEQEILVLFYKLIFESDVNLLLIDEPEISLHIAWQKELMQNIKSVVKLKKNTRVIIATHSPQILSNNWDLQVDLGGQYNG